MMQPEGKKKVYFPNLNGIRFIAAFLIILHHAELLKFSAGLPNYWEAYPFFEMIGKQAVVLFFVLSGFLITYLLLAEEHFFKRISIKNFYVRRILRIWPLYFLIIGLAYFVLPNIPAMVIPGHEKQVLYQQLGLKLVLYVFFLANLVLAKFGIDPYVSQTWSIGTEEQFYLVWPVFLSKVKRNRLAIMFTVIFLYMAMERLLASSISDHWPQIDVLRSFWLLFNIDCMVIGAVFAVLLFRNHSLLRWLMQPVFFYVVLSITCLLLILGIRLPVFQNEFYAILFGVIILNFAANKRNRISLENRAFNFLGNISYGMYMFHPIAILLAFGICTSTGMMRNMTFYPLSVLLTILFAAVSYYLFERHFLKLKEKFSSIVSGNFFRRNAG
ncbi:acyltransferase [Pollutibacter soli]|uniref:acyltransferase family protein n=1 Tax=Pollutibacter soli TaxID=3034157 RepID=UPI0030139C8F